MSQGGNCEIDGKFDGEDFQSLLSAMQVLGFTSDEQDTIFRILASGKQTQILMNYGHNIMVTSVHS
jgi:5-enolpyruvylshikimate-3-phosphate synthase